MIIKLMIEGINLSNLYSARQFIMPLILLNTGMLLGNFFENINVKNKIVIFIVNNLTLLVIIGTIIWFLPNQFIYNSIYSEIFRSLSYPESGREFYIDVIQSAKNDGKYGYYREVGDTIFTRNFGPYFSPLTLAFSCLIIFILSNNKLIKLLVTLILYSSFTRAVILVHTIYIIYNSKFRYMSIGIIAVFFIMYLDILSKVIIDSSTLHHIASYVNIPFGFNMFGSLNSAAIGAKFNNSEFVIGESFYLTLIYCLGILGAVLYTGLFFWIYLISNNSKYKYLILSVMLIGFTSEVVLGVSGYGIFYLLIGMSIQKPSQSLNPMD